MHISFKIARIGLIRARVFTPVSFPPPQSSFLLMTVHLFQCESLDRQNRVDKISPFLVDHSALADSEIKGTLRLFDGLALDGVRVDHGGSHITVPKQLLNRTDIVIGL